MKDKLYFLKVGFVRKLIFQKHSSLIKKSIASVRELEGNDELKEEILADLHKQLFCTHDKIMRDWIDFYYANKDGRLLRKIYQKLYKNSSADNIKIKSLSGVRYLMEYLNWYCMRRIS